MELKEHKELSSEEIGAIREVSDDLFEQLSSKNSKIITKDLVFHIYLALVISIVNFDIFDFFDNDNKNINNEYFQNKYDDLINIKKDNFSAKDLKKRTEAKYNYYERAIKIRSEIQNRIWSYHNLDSDTATFLRTRELTKIMYNRTKTMESKKQYYKCYVCSTKWLDNENDLCPRCEKDNDLSMFIAISNYFCVISDMDNFYKNLNPDTEKVLLDNCGYITEYFRKETRKGFRDW
jgi:rubrerythrin